MGGLIIVVMWPMVLPILILKFLGFALPVIAPVLLALNAAGLAGLLLIRRLWKRSGTMDRTCIEAQTGWRRTILRILRWILWVCIAWEALLVILCGAYVLWMNGLLGGIPFWPRRNANKTGCGVTITVGRGIILLRFVPINGRNYFGRPRQCVL